MRLFKLKIVPDKRMIPVALTAMRETARYFFADETTVEHISLALEEAIANVTEFCLSDSLESIDIEAELCDDDSFVMTVTDKGIPGDLDKMLGGEKGLGLSLMSRMVDKISSENMGAQGRRQRMVKYLSEKPKFEIRPVPELEATAPDIHLTIRPLKETEAIEVARCIYDEFGLTYVNETVYYPERFYSAVQKGEIYSLVAVTDSGEIAAHLAMWEWSVLPGIWEMGMGVVKHQFRKVHVMEKLVQEIITYARDEKKLPGLLAEPVLYHPYTQKISNKFDFFACGAGLAYTAASLKNTINNMENTRDSLALAMNIFKREARTLYLPDELNEMVEEILARMALPATIVNDETLPQRDECESFCENYSTLQLGRIVIYHTGKNVEFQLRHLAARLKRHSAEVIELFIMLNEPEAVFAYEAAKKQGYFCTGFLPMSKCGDMLMMQNLMAQAVDYDALQTVEPFTGLLERIRTLDPNEMQEENEKL